MPTYPVTIRRCQHIKVNGIQCGSPALRNERHCYFHDQSRAMSRQIDMKCSEHRVINLPTLEDANSIQLGLAEVMRLLVTNQIDHRTASLLLRALRTAAANVKFTSFEPKPTHVVIDPSSVENRPLGATAWSTVEGRDYDLVEKNNNVEEKSHAESNSLKRDAERNAKEAKATGFEAYLGRLIEGCARDPNYLDRPAQKEDYFGAAAETQSAPPFPGNRERSPENRL
jgi:hypothetical protein